jgi:hypothetical protein
MRMPDEGGGQQTLPFQADSGVRQFGIGRGLIIGEQIKQGLERRPGPGQQGIQSRLAASNLGPVIVQRAVADPIEPRGQWTQMGFRAVGEQPQSALIGCQQIEPGIGVRTAAHGGQQIMGLLGRADKIADQVSSRGGASHVVPRFAHVGQGAEPAARGDGQPAATTLQIAAAHHVRRVLPGRRRQSGALVKFIAIGGDHQPVMGLGTPGNKQQAHTFWLVSG